MGSFHKGNLAERLRRKTAVRGSGECWIWLGAPNSAGYGRMSYRGERQYVHRLAWESANGAIPAGMFVDHMCHNRMCVNVSHLRLVTPAQNTQNLRGATARSTTGIRGVYPHPAGGWQVQVAGEAVGYFQNIEEAERSAVAARRARLPYSITDLSEGCPGDPATHARAEADTNNQLGGLLAVGQ